MPMFSFFITSNGSSKGAIVAHSASREEARREALAICADFGRDIFAEIASGNEWRMTVTDETGTTIFRLRICDDEV